MFFAVSRSTAVIMVDDSQQNDNSESEAGYEIYLVKAGNGVFPCV